MELRRGTPSDAAAIAALIASFQPELTLDPTGAGAEQYLASVSEQSERGYLESERYAFLLAEIGAELAGFIALRDGRHLFHLFVARRHQRRGLARQLWRAASTEALVSGEPGQFTVISSMNAVRVYTALGFVAVGPVVTGHGIAFQPMQRSATEHDA